MNTKSLSQLFSIALKKHMNGQLDAAINDYQEILTKFGDHADTLHQLGIAYIQKGQIEQALCCLEKSATLDVKQPNVLSNWGYCLNLAKKHKDAEKVCLRALRVEPENDAAWTNLGNSYRGLKNLPEAESAYRTALNLQPNNARYSYNLANTLHALEKFQLAKDHYLKTIQIDPLFAEAYNNLSVCLIELEALTEAVQYVNKALQLRPDYAEAWNNKGLALSKLKRIEESFASYDHAIALNPNYSEAVANRANLLCDMRRFSFALTEYERAIKLNPTDPKLWSNRGNALCAIRYFNEAIQSYDHALKINERYAEAWANRGNVFLAIKDWSEALRSYKRAIDVEPDYAEAWAGLANVQSDGRQFQDALESYKKAYRLKPDINFLLGDILRTQIQICDWRDLNERLSVMEQKIRCGDKVSVPFVVVGLYDSPELQALAARLFAEPSYLQSNLPKIGAVDMRHRDDEKIKIGYFSADFHNHATMYLMAELFESHDKSQFEIYAFSFGPPSSDEMRQRLLSSVDKFIDVSCKSDLEIAMRSRELGIDIAVDLKGYTENSRTAIFYERCAPIQVNYLGYPGTMGLPYFDYIVADKTVITAETSNSFTESIVYMPDSYQVNDSNRRISNSIPNREEVGLPSNVFVFCCFNNNWKILPGVFEVWMNILKAVDQAVLWLFEENTSAAFNLKKEAEKRGVSPERLVFAKSVPLDLHLARYKLADLFLDTFPYNAHTTASDALWAGLPVLTCKGTCFASRVAASLLNTLDLNELIVNNLKEYESRAIELALSPDSLNRLAHRLESTKSTSALFQGKVFTRNLEKAYKEMFNRYQQELSPGAIYISAQ